MLIGLLAAPLIFVLCAWLTRAQRARIISALAGGFAYSALNFGWDQAARAAGWWTYVVGEGAASLPVVNYGIASLLYAAFALFGWRLARGYGRRGLLIFLLFWVVWGLLHDLSGAAAFAGGQAIVFHPGPVALLADLLLYLTGMSAALAVIRWLGGPYKRDRLRKYIGEG
ncbi:MAG TPA: hypothetical protein VMT46_06330 [Anaerolineaceae bacterium]|nr:hypothetical protein [Anaerolineaceae bacterium]